MVLLNCLIRRESSRGKICLLLLLFLLLPRTRSTLPVGVHQLCEPSRHLQLLQGNVKLVKSGVHVVETDGKVHRKVNANFLTCGVHFFDFNSRNNHLQLTVVGGNQGETSRVADDGHFGVVGEQGDGVFERLKIKEI